MYAGRLTYYVVAGGFGVGLMVVLDTFFCSCLHASSPHTDHQFQDFRRHILLCMHSALISELNAGCHCAVPNVVSRSGVVVVGF